MTSELAICCGTYSYCRGAKGNKPVNNLRPSEALKRIAANGFTHVYVGGGEIGDLIGAPLGSAEVDMAKVAAARDVVAAQGLFIHACLIGFSLDADDAVEVGKRTVEQAAALGLRWICEFGPSGPAGEEEKTKSKYVELMRTLAPYAQAHGVGISMKPHGTCLTNADLVAVHEAVGHPAFGICMDPGNILYYTKGEALPTDGIESLAPCVSAVVMKDCTLNPNSPQEEEYEVDEGEPLPKVDVLVLPGTGKVDFDPLLSALQSPRVGFAGPLLLEKVPGRTLEEIDENFRKAKEFVAAVAKRTAAAAASL